MLNACNQAWTMYPGLLHGAYESIKAHGSDELQARYLPRLASGEWLAAMALTEPQAGTDLGLVRTRADVQADGTLRVSGNKIFISGGEHDLTDNIVHLVLCRLADAPPGTKGLSLALVPKWLPDGSRNAMHCDGLEKKMGIKGSATCAMRYEGATGWLIGEPNRGLAAMFIMMNSARLHVGLQGLGQIEMASQNALRYARERVQMKRVVRTGEASKSAADAIVSHPAMRRILLRLQAVTQGCRVLAYRAAQLIDEAHGAEEASQRERADALAAVLTPIVKAFITHQGFHGAVAAQQVYGGYGYIHEYGVEQAVRDSRIAMIYEGTNEIQAIDLLVRKVLGSNGPAFEALLADLSTAADRCDGEPALADFSRALRQQIDQARRATQALRSDLGSDPERPFRIADDYLMAMGLLLLAWAWTASARAAIDAGDYDEWMQRKLAVCRHGIDWVLPEASVHWQRVMQPVLALPEIVST